ncbi:MAG: hypothetical protein HY897_11145 [Deltaproteobacteria bacterium]|nr:hypothetical protein [Deltaproteobacteria bacterium]
MSAIHAGRKQGDEALTVSLSGSWHGSGCDREGTTWTWKLTLEHDKTKLKGTFHWYGSRGQHGTEHVKGEFNPGSRTFLLKGMDVEHAERVGPNTYFGYVDEDHASLVGYWTDWVPGVFLGSRR